MNSAILVAVMALTTMLLRFLPFLAFREQIPKYIVYLGKVLPSAMIGLLVIYCIKDVSPAVYPFGLPELFATLCVIILQVLKRNSLISILSGTVIYMVLIQLF